VNISYKEGDSALYLRSPNATSSVRRNSGKWKLANCNGGTEIGSESRCSDPTTAGANGEEVEIVVPASTCCSGAVVSGRGRVAGGEAAVGEAEDERRAGNGGVRSGLGMKVFGKGKGSSEGLEGFGREGEPWDA
jgi:hypothetical protein